MNNKKMLALVLAMAVVVAGCMPGPTVTRLPKWQPPVNIPRFGDWVVEPETCLIRAGTQDVQAETTGKLENGVLAVKLDFPMQLVQPPTPSMSGLPVPMPLDGAWRGFRTYIAYDSQTVAHMMDPGTFVVIAYQPLNSQAVREVHFDTRGLLQAIAHVGKTCK